MDYVALRRRVYAVEMLQFLGVSLLFLLLLLLLGITVAQDKMRFNLI